MIEIGWKTRTKTLRTDFLCLAEILACWWDHDIQGVVLLDALSEQLGFLESVHVALTQRKEEDNALFLVEMYYT
jgi:hypothetical protein